MGKILILSVTDHEEHILNKIMETIANEPELNHIAPPLPCNILSFTNLEIRLKEQTVSCSGQLVTLTHHEFAVLTYLARHPGWVFSASQIYEAVWDRDGERCRCQYHQSDPAQVDAGYTKGWLYPHCTGQWI